MIRGILEEDADLHGLAVTLPFVIAIPSSGCRSIPDFQGAYDVATMTRWTAGRSGPGEAALENKAIKAPGEAETPPPRTARPARAPVGGDASATTSSCWNPWRGGGGVVADRLLVTMGSTVLKVNGRCPALDSGRPARRPHPAMKASASGTQHSPTPAAPPHRALTSRLSAAATAFDDPEARPWPNTALLGFGSTSSTPTLPTTSTTTSSKSCRRRPRSPSSTRWCTMPASSA